jgi:hypothetical protein
MGVQERCKLCNQKKEIVNSHILPEFLYENLYDDKHKVISVSSIPGEKEHYIQKGLREHLLCKECETKFSQYEGYSSKILHSLPIKSMSSQNPYIELTNIDYLKFKLFQLSILWRSSIAKGPMFSAINLGQKHENNIHRMLLTEDPGKYYQYGCLILIIQNPEKLDKLIWSPIKDRIEGHICYRFLISGIFWYFFVTSHSENNPYRYCFLSEEGILRLFMAPWSEKEIVHRIAGLIKSKYDENHTGPS